MPKYRKKPVVIDALRWTGANVQEMTNFLVGYEVHIAAPDYEPEFASCIARFDFTVRPAIVKIQTLKGEMTASAGDWIIRGVKGLFYSCKPDIFEAEYEAVPALVVHLRVVVLREGEWFVAQALEQDVASQAKSLVGVIEDVALMFAARDQHPTAVEPPPAPQDYVTLWERGIDLGVCSLGDRRTAHVRLATTSAVPE